VTSENRIVPCSKCKVTHLCRQHCLRIPVGKNPTHGYVHARASFSNSGLGPTGWVVTKQLADGLDMWPCTTRHLRDACKERAPLWHPAMSGTASRKSGRKRRNLLVPNLTKQEPLWSRSTCSLSSVHPLVFLFWKRDGNMNENVLGTPIGDGQPV